MGRIGKIPARTARRGTPHPTSPLKKGGGEKWRRFAFLTDSSPLSRGIERKAAPDALTL